MEIFIKADDKTHKINWLSSIPDKYKEDILKKVKEQVLLNEKSQQKLSSAPKDSSRRRRSQEADNRNMTEHELSKLRGLLGFQGANYIDKPSKEGGETYEVILNIKANKSPKKNNKSSQSSLSKGPNKEFLSQYVSGISSQKTLGDGKLPNLLRNASVDINNEYNNDTDDFGSRDSRNLDRQLNVDSNHTLGNSLADKTNLINLRNMTLSSLRNTYCVQYMGINDDRLEVLTRRVLLDKNYKQAQAPRKYFNTNRDHVIKYERKPQKLAPIYKEPVAKDELVQEPVIENEPVTVIEEVKSEQKSIEHEEEPNDEDDEPPVAMVTRPKDDREDFIIPVENIVHEEVHDQAIQNNIVNNKKDNKSQIKDKEKKTKSTKKKSVQSRQKKSITRKEKEKSENKSKSKDAKSKLPMINTKSKKSKIVVEKKSTKDTEVEIKPKQHSKSSSSLMMSQIKDKKKIVADIGTNLEYKTNRINPSQIMNIITDGANPYQSLDSPNCASALENMNDEYKQESEGMLANSINIELSSVKEGAEESQNNYASNIQDDVEDVIMPRPDKWDK